MLTKVEFKPGIVLDDTSLATEGGWINSNHVRSRRGRPEVLGFLASSDLPSSF